MTKRILSIFCFLLLLTGCGFRALPGSGGGASELRAVTVLAMDTVMNIKAYGGDEEVLERAEERIRELENLLSVTYKRSEIYALNQNGSAELSGDTAALLGRALELCRETEGALDISIYPVVRAWGFTTVGDYRVPEDGELEELLKHVDYTQIDLTGDAAALPEGMEVDLGSVAKGYTGDQLIELLRESGVNSALLDLGGNIQTLGSKPDGSAWRVAVQSPAGGCLGYLSVVDQAVITSGGYERYFEDEDGNTYWHIMDPATGRPAQSGLTSVTIVGEEGAYCDALSTALFIMGEEKAVSFWRTHGDFEMLLVTEDGRLLVTDGLTDCFQNEAEAGYEMVVIGDA